MTAIDLLEPSAASSDTSETRFRAMADNTPVMIWRADPENRGIWFNRMWLEFTGRTLEQELGYGWAELIHPEDAHRAVQYCQSHLQQRQPFEMEFRMRRHDGEYRWMLDRGVPVFDPPEQRFSGYIGSCIDITERKHAEEALRESETRLRLAAQAAGFGTYHLDMQTGHNDWSVEAKAIAGLDADADVSRERVLQLIHPDDRERVDALMRASLDPHGSGEFYDEHRLVRPDGSVRWVMVKGKTFFVGESSERRAIRATGTMLDITERKRAEDARRDTTAALSAVFEAAPVAVLLVALDGTILEWNRAAERIFGWSAAEAVGRFFPFVPPERHQEALHNLARVLDRGVINGLDLTRYRKDGSTVEVSLSAALLRNTQQQPVGIVACLEDISARKAAEHELQQRLAELDEANRRKTEFLAILAHELRNPLAPIRHATAIAKQPTATTEQLIWTREIIERQVQHMARLLDDLLEMSRITRGTLELRKELVELRTVIDTAVETARPTIESQRHTLQINAPMERTFIHADPVRLVQIIANLLTNAAKYTPKGGQIELQVTAQHPWLKVSVKDSGIGIQPEMLPRLFEMFAQADATSPTVGGGLGIGLALARGLTQLHGGDIQAHSEGLGKGSEFIVQLPVLLTGSISDRPAPSAISVNQTARRVLIADDNIDSAESLAMLLRLSGHDVVTAHTGKQALEQARTFQPHCALLDIGMPELNGYQVAEHIRKHQWGRDIRLIAVTGWGQQDDKERAAAAGFDLHLTKPLDPARLRQLLGTTE